MSVMGSQITTNSIELSALCALCEVHSKSVHFSQILPITTILGVMAWPAVDHNTKYSEICL